MADLTAEEERNDWYGILELGVQADDGAIRKAFKRMSLKWHPDKNQGSKEAHDMFMRIQEAKNFLLDAKKRKLYDEKRVQRQQMESQQAERNRNMGQRRRQMREELERRENGIVGGRSDLGPGGEARVEAARRKAKLEELRKAGEALRKQRSKEQKVAWDAARAKAKRRDEAAAAAASDDDLEERTVRVKWKRKESHSDYTLDRLFSRFGTVESVSIEVGSGNRALVTFTSPTAADAAVAAYKENEDMRASYVGKRRPKRPAFASRPETTPSFPAQDIPSMGSFRDHESLVMMKMRQEAERQALIQKMVEEEGATVENGGASREGTGKVGGNSTGEDSKGLRQEGVVEQGASGGAHSGRSVESPKRGAETDGGAGSNPGLAEESLSGKKDMANMDHKRNPKPAALSSSGGDAAISRGDSGVTGTSHDSEKRASGGFTFCSVKNNEVQAKGLSPREDDPLSVTMRERGHALSGAYHGTNSTTKVGAERDATPSLASDGRGVGDPPDESDILARMMRFKK